MTDQPDLPPELVKACCRAMCIEGGFDPDEMMPNDGPRWRYYETQALAIIPLVQADAEARIVADLRHGIHSGFATIQALADRYERGEHKQESQP